MYLPPFVKRVPASLPFIGLWLVLALGLCSYAVYDNEQERKLVFKRAQIELETVARLMRDQVERTIDGVDRTLSMFKVIHEKQLTQALQSNMFDGVRSADQEQRRVLVFDRDGRLVTSTDPAFRVSTASIADRDYFRDASSLASTDLHIGVPVKSRISGQTVLPMAKRVDAPDASFDGVVVQGIDLEKFGSLYTLLSPGPSDVLGIVTDNGTVVARSGEEEGRMSVGAVDPALSIEIILETQLESGVFEERTIAAIPSHVVFQRISGTRLVVFAARGNEALMAEHGRLVERSWALVILAMMVVTFPIVLAARYMAREVGQRRKLEDRVEHERERARRDPLTGVANRHVFDERVAASYRTLDADNIPFVVAFVDVDRFKQLNDARGHAVGDAALRKIAQTLSEGIRSTDVVARLGGDEFGVLLSGANALAARHVLEQRAKALHAAVALAEWPITFSIGVVTFWTAPPAEHHVVDIADGVMYAVKKTGGNGIKFAVYRDRRLIDQEKVAPPRIAA
ncbi:MAG: sensor domain-containing diguanylate cyclase [Casimicrobiaceae bacterium]